MPTIAVNILNAKTDLGGTTRIKTPTDSNYQTKADEAHERALLVVAQTRTFTGILMLHCQAKATATTTTTATIAASSLSALN